MGEQRRRLLLFQRGGGVGCSAIAGGVTRRSEGKSFVGVRPCVEVGALSREAFFSAAAAAVFLASMFSIGAVS